jgi:hypothetical protein
MTGEKRAVALVVEFNSGPTIPYENCASPINSACAVVWLVEKVL